MTGIIRDKLLNKLKDQFAPIISTLKEIKETDPILYCQLEYIDERVKDVFGLIRYAECNNTKTKNATSNVTVLPAHERDYTSKRAMLHDFATGRDFTHRNLDGFMTSGVAHIEDFFNDVGWTTLQFRYENSQSTFQLDRTEFLKYLTEYRQYSRDVVETYKRVGHDAKPGRGIEGMKKLESIKEKRRSHD